MLYIYDSPSLFEGLIIVFLFFCTCQTSLEHHLVCMCHDICLLTDARVRICRLPPPPLIWPMFCTCTTHLQISHTNSSWWLEARNLTRPMVPTLGVGKGHPIAMTPLLPLIEMGWTHWKSRWPECHQTRVANCTWGHYLSNQVLYRHEQHMRWVKMGLRHPSEDVH